MHIACVRKSKKRSEGGKIGEGCIGRAMSRNTQLYQKKHKKLCCLQTAEERKYSDNKMLALMHHLSLVTHQSLHSSLAPFVFPLWALQSRSV